MKKLISIIIALVLATAMFTSFAETAEDIACNVVNQINSMLLSFDSNSMVYTNESVVQDDVFAFTSDSAYPYLLLSSDGSNLCTGGFIATDDIATAQVTLYTALSFFIAQGYVDDIPAMADWVDANCEDLLTAMENDTQIVFNYIGDSNTTTLTIAVIPTENGTLLEAAMNIYPEGVPQQ